MEDVNKNTPEDQDTILYGADLRGLNRNQLKLAEKISSTKFILVLISISLAFIGLWLGKMPPNVFSEIVQWTVSAYILGNAFIQSKWGK